MHDARYAGLDPRLLPATESLKDTLARVLPLWNEEIAPQLRAGRNVLVAAHGNSIRAIVKMLDDVPESEIVELNIPTGVPLLYEFDDALKPTGHRYLGDPEAIKAAAEAVRTPDRESARTTSSRLRPSCRRCRHAASASSVKRALSACISGTARRMVRCACTLKSPLSGSCLVSTS